MATVDYKPGVLYVHQFPRWCTRGVVSRSPFGMKLETWLRLKNVPYQAVCSMRFSKTGQIPFLVLDGEEYSDISLVAKQRDIDVFEGLTPEQLGIARCVMRMMDEVFCVSYFLYHYSYHADQYKTLASRFIKNLHDLAQFDPLKPKLLNRGDVMGFGRYGEQYVVESGAEDIRALSRLLGDKTYLMGDQIHLVDCSVFGHLVQSLYSVLPNHPYKALLVGECHNLVEYCERIKAVCWPDWDQILQEADTEYNDHPDKIVLTT